MKLNFTFILFLSFFTTGCAITYQEPTQGELATLEMPVKHVKVGFGANSSRYIFAIKDTDSNCGKTFKDIPPKMKGDKTVTVNIPANREILVANFSTQGSYSFCDVAGSFMAVKDKEYKLMAAPLARRCSVYVLQKIGENYNPVKLEGAKLDSLNGTEICKNKKEQS